ncbi:hypothetical protein O4J56_04160 [Nocardiopsis sp. RSe5-2]|uniref:Protein kinase domain-containing protein n=1 Tax=Nocardiopsis endophytica TaxID=3018445 RepID=A0ABT4U001_9ACTN|nr:hypothetical protein [Nocardiopsis endophytica]MDA2809824.1 hypothetical protein [Nocardiopsis endophytica]
MEAHLGAGGMGRVFLARSPGGHPVAVKMIRPELPQDAGFRRRFAREVGAARKVTGFFTAEVVDADADAHRPWMATAYITGPSLAEAVDAHRPLHEGLTATRPPATAVPVRRPPPSRPSPGRA